MVKRRNKKRPSSSIPFDLVIEILLRLPAKSIARFRCVSKLWDSTLCSPDFKNSFSTISSSRPKILFTCQKDGKTFFFTSQQPRSSSSLAANFLMSFHINHPIHMFRPVRGLVCGLNHGTWKGQEVFAPLICDPSTGQSLTLPELERISYVTKTRLGYDPIDNKFKLLCMTHSNRAYQVLTLEPGKKLLWRMIKCDIPHSPAGVDCRHGYYVFDEICIQGVCYYFAWMQNDIVVICFDIRSEKFKFIRHAQGMSFPLNNMFKSTLVNYKGKLAKLQLIVVAEICSGIQLWVLKDAEKHEWLNHIYDFPLLFKNIVGNTKLRCVGLTATGDEIVFSPKIISDSFYLLYYNPKKNTTTKVEIQGMEAHKDQTAYIFLDHVEDLKLMASVS